MGPTFYLNIFIREVDRDHTHKRETVKAKVGMRELQAKVCWQSLAAGRGKKWLILQNLLRACRLFNVLGMGILSSRTVREYA